MVHFCPNVIACTEAYFDLQKADQSMINFTKNSMYYKLSKLIARVLVNTNTFIDVFMITFEEVKQIFCAYNFNSPLSVIWSY